MSWDDVAPNPKATNDTGVGNSFFEDAVINSGGDNRGGCFNCGEEGHIRSECPNPRAASSGGCFNCGQEGHMKSECPNPRIAREFTGTCRLCEKEGHRAGDCPSAPTKVCKNCGEEGHQALECKNPRLIDRKHVAEIMPECAWEELKVAVSERDMDDVKEAIQKYVKGIPTITYTALEQAFRSQGLNIYLIALERDIAVTYTNMDLQGNLNKKYTISYRFSDKPKRPREAEGWPQSTAENIERLRDAGEPVDRGVPKCNNCGTLGHTQKFCTEEKQENVDRVEVKCYNCDAVGHRVRDCPNPREDKFACRNCKQPGHSSKECPEPRSADGVECNKCHEMGHFSRDCPTGGGGDNTCRNCGQEGHRAKDCTEERVMTCRNCDEKGHVSKECPKPRDYSRVKCSNCQKMGHTKVRCKEPIADEGAGGDTGHSGFSNNAIKPVPVETDDNWGATPTIEPVPVETDDNWGAPTIVEAPIVEDTSDW